MKVVIVFNHPNEGSFCSAILSAVIHGLKSSNHDVDVMHLDDDGFNPVMSKADLKAIVERKPIDS